MASSSQQEEWEREQEALVSKLDIEDRIAIDQIKLIGGVDISFVKEGSNFACAALIILSFPDLQVVHKEIRWMPIEHPYIPGFLAFREVPLLLPLIEDVRKNHPEFLPQVIVVDGNGVLHPRGFGLACHLGVFAGIPMVGVAKTFMHVDGLNEMSVRESLDSQLTAKGQAAPIVGLSGAVWGVAMRTTENEDGTFKPIYVSAGHMIGLDTATEIVRQCCVHRIPEPVRQADVLSRKFIREHPPPTTQE